MGMFDSFIDERGHDWQTKAYDCVLAEYDTWDTLPRSDWPDSYPHTYQVEVLGATEEDPFTRSYATVHDDVLSSIHDARDTSLPLIDYSGHLIAEGI